MYATLRIETCIEGRNNREIGTLIIIEITLGMNIIVTGSCRLFNIIAICYYICQLKLHNATRFIWWITFTWYFNDIAKLYMSIRSHSKNHAVFEESIVLCFFWKNKGKDRISSFGFAKKKWNGVWWNSFHPTPFIYEMKWNILII